MIEQIIASFFDPLAALIIGAIAFPVARNFGRMRPISVVAMIIIGSTVSVAVGMNSRIPAVPQDLAHREPGFNPWDVIKGTEYEPEWPYFVAVHNKAAADWMFRQVDRRVRDCTILEGGHRFGLLDRCHRNGLVARAISGGAVGVIFGALGIGLLQIPKRR